MPEVEPPPQDGMTCEDTCCDIGDADDAFRAPSMWADFIHGWLFCLHLTELTARTFALIRWQRVTPTPSTSSWFEDVLAGKVPALVMLLVNLFAFTGTLNVLGNALHYACMIPETLSYVFPWKDLLHTAIFTSVQALLTSNLFSVLAETSTRSSERQLARLVVWYSFAAFVSYPLVSGFVALSNRRLFFLVFSAQYMLQTSITSTLSLVALRMIHRMASIQPSSGITVGLRRFALICAVPALIASVQLALDLAEYLVDADFPDYVWHFCYASQAYYMYFVFAPLRKLLPLELRPIEDPIAADTTSDREIEYRSARGSTELTKLPFQTPSHAEDQPDKRTQATEKEARGRKLSDVQVDIGHVYPQNPSR